MKASKHTHTHTQVSVVPYPQARGLQVLAPLDAAATHAFVFPTPVSEKSPGAQGGGYGGDRQGAWRGEDPKKRWDKIGDRQAFL
jgi:hypothetical protein